MGNQFIFYSYGGLLIHLRQAAIFFVAEFQELAEANQ